MPVLQGPPNRACYKHTCAIQRCLSESNYDTRACQWAVDALKRCCEHDFAVGSIHCAFPDLKRRQQKATQEIERKQPQVGDDDKEKNGIGGQEKATA